MPEADTGAQIVIQDRALRERFTQAPVDVLLNGDLAPGPKVTYLLLLTFAWQEGFCYPGQARMAASLGCSVGALHSYLQTLQEAGYISITRRGRNWTNVYTILERPPILKNPDSQILGFPISVNPGVAKSANPDSQNLRCSKTQRKIDSEEIDAASAGHAREDGEGRKVDAGPPVVETSSEDLSSVTDATVRFVLTTVPGIPRTEAAITQVQLQCQAARHANPALPIRGETLLCVRYWASKNETVQSWLRAWARWMEGAIKRPNPEAAALEAELPQETPPYDYPPSGVPFYDRLSAWCCWLADNANLPQRQLTDYEFMHLRPLSYDPASGELRLSARYPEGVPERAGQPVYEYKREQWPSTFRKIAERHMNTKITVVWVESEVPV